MDEEFVDSAHHQDERYRLFNFAGKVRVIAVSFIEGSQHLPKSVNQLLHVAKSPKRMHDAGFVHGDVVTALEHGLHGKA
jgi:tRNA A-37 threonylcarbamoyl transferase component Bud32